MPLGPNGSSVDGSFDLQRATFYAGRTLASKPTKGLPSCFVSATLVGWQYLLGALCAPKGDRDAKTDA